jgi:hypothetical protein
MSCARSSEWEERHRDERLERLLHPLRRLWAPRVELHALEERPTGEVGMSKVTLQDVQRCMAELEQLIGPTPTLLRKPRFDSIALGSRALSEVAKAGAADGAFAPSLFGMKVRSLPARLARIPKMQLSRPFAEQMPPDWVAEQNAWLAEFFGHHEVAYLIDESALGFDPLARLTLGA